MARIMKRMACLTVAGLLVSVAMAAEPPPCPSPEVLRAECRKETQRLMDLVTTADSLAVTDLRLRLPDAPPRNDHYETSDPGEIAEFNSLFLFDNQGVPGVEHFCAGHPGVIWRKEGKVVAKISIGHGESIRWDGFGYWVGDVPLNKESRERLAEWFLSRGIHIAEEWHLGKTDELGKEDSSQVNPRKAIIGDRNDGAEVHPGEDENDDIWGWGFEAADAAVDDEDSWGEGFGEDVDPWGGAFPSR